MEQKVMNIAIAVNEKFIKYACVMLTSVFENHRDRELQVFVLYGQAGEEELEHFRDLASRYNQTIHLVKMKKEWFPEELPHTKEWPLEVYYRLALPDILPEDIERILYLDVDVIVKDSIWDFYNTDFQGKSLCVCPDMSVLDGGLMQKQYDLFKEYMRQIDFKYFNAGILLMNIKKMRENVSLDFFVQMGLKLNIGAQDQDLLNYVFYKDVRYLEETKYNLFAKIAYNQGLGYDWVKENTSIIHFAGRKPWQHEALHFNTEKFWWQYAKLTPFYTQLLEDFVWNEVDSGFMNDTVEKLNREKLELSTALEKCMDLLKRIGM